MQRIFALARDVATWPSLLGHYRAVVFESRNPDGGGVVRMSAYRPFGPIGWAVWWRSLMMVDELTPRLRFRHVGGVTTGMDVEWSFTETPAGTHVRVVHVWDGPRWPLVRGLAARAVIGPVFVHAIASRTLAGLALAAEGGAAHGGAGGAAHGRA